MLRAARSAKFSSIVKKGGNVKKRLKNSYFINSSPEMAQKVNKLVNVYNRLQSPALAASWAAVPRKVAYHLRFFLNSLKDSELELLFVRP